MSSEVQENENISIIDYLNIDFKFYKLGKFDKCMELHNKLKNPRLELLLIRKQIDLGRNPLSEEILRCIFASNHQICCMLKEVTRCNYNADVWNTLLCKYLDVFDCYKFMNQIPLPLRATMLYNCLYMFLLKQSHLDLSFKYRIRFACSQFITCVLKKLDIDVDEAGSWEDDRLLGLMTHLSSNLLKLRTLECLVMMDILNLLLLISKTELTNGYLVQFSKRYLESIDQFEIHFNSDKMDFIKAQGISKYYFMFAFDTLNHHLELNNYKTSIATFFITIGYLNCENGLYNEANTILEACQKFTVNIPFTENLRRLFNSYAMMRTGNFSRARYILSGLNLFNGLYTIRLHMLSAMIDMEEHKYEDAIMKLMKIRPNHRNASYMLSVIFGIMNDSVSQLRILGLLAWKIKENEIDYALTYSDFIGDVLFSNLRWSYLDVHYMYATLNFQKGQYEAALRSYEAVLKTSTDVGIKPWLMTHKDVSLRSIYHQAIITNMKTNNWKNAKKLAELITSHASPSNDKIEEERNLAECFGENVVGLVLLADVYEYERNLVTMLEILNRCGCIIENELETFPECNHEMKLYCKLLLIKILLRISSLEWKNDLSTSMDCMSKAKQLIPDYPEISRVYKLHSSNQEEDNTHYKNEYIEKCKDAVLKYILEKGIEVNVPEDDSGSLLSMEADFCLDDGNDELFVNL